MKNQEKKMKIRNDYLIPFKKDYRQALRWWTK